MTPQLQAEVSEYRKPRSLRQFWGSIKCQHKNCAPRQQCCRQLKRVNWWEREYVRPQDMNDAQRRAALKAAFTAGKQTREVA